MPTRKSLKRTRILLLLPALLALSFVLLLMMEPASAIEPPRAGELLSLRANQDLTERLTLARQLGNQEVDPVRLRQAINRTVRGFLRSQGRTAAEVSALVPPLAPPPAWQGMPTTGTVKVLTVLVDFQDHKHAHGRDIIHDALFGDGDPSRTPYESLARYYDRASYKMLDLSQGNTLGWYQTAYNRSEVKPTQTGRENLIKEVLTHFDAQGHDFKQYDNNGDGVIDYFMVIWAGPDTGWSSFWWGYQTSFIDGGYTLDGVRLGKYSWQWESNPIGSGFDTQVVIHETGHALGVPDYYDYDPAVGPDGGVGRLDMMDGNKGDHTCFSKWMLDWLTPRVVASGTTTLSLKASGEEKDCVIIWPGITTGDLFSEFFVVENRHRVGNDAALGMPSDGILIWHVDAHLDPSGSDFAYDNSFTSHKLLRLMEADGLEEIEGGLAADSDDYYATGDAFGVATVPSSQRYDGTASGVEVDNFFAAGPQMSATFRVQEVPSISPQAALVETAGLPAQLPRSVLQMTQSPVRNLSQPPKAEVGAAQSQSQRASEDRTAGQEALRQLLRERATGRGEAVVQPSKEEVRRRTEAGTAGEQAGSVVGASACSLCYTCGSDWPLFSGVIPTRPDAHPWERGPACSGDLSAQPDEMPYLCCR
jgi:M6 family metalloprotease-like protein